MKKPNLIIYESTMEIFEEFGVDEDYELAFEYMTAIFNYYRTGQEYSGKSREIRLLLKDIYPLINTQQDNYTKKVESVISNEEFIELATSGKFITQKALAEHITQYYGDYTQSAVSKRLKALGVNLVKTPPTPPTPSQSNPSVNPALEQEISDTYGYYLVNQGYTQQQAIEKTAKDHGITPDQVRQIMKGE